MNNEAAKLDRADRNLIIVGLCAVALLVCGLMFWQQWSAHAEAVQANATEANKAQAKRDFERDLAVSMAKSKLLSIKSDAADQVPHRVSADKIVLQNALPYLKAFPQEHPAWSDVQSVVTEAEIFLENVGFKERMGGSTSDLQKIAVYADEALKHFK
jgi:hypothetical protein